MSDTARMHLILAALIAFLLTCPGTAFSQQAACSSFNHAGWNQNMDLVDQLVKRFDLSTANQVLGETRKQIPCLDKVARPSHLVRFARQMALVAFFSQDEITAGQWASLQATVAPSLPWPDAFPEAHPARQGLEEILADQGTPSPISLDNKGWIFPRKGGVFINGSLAPKPTARAEVPALVQFADKKGGITKAYWQDGAAFRPEDLGEPVAMETPKWFLAEDLGTVAVATTTEPEVVDRPPIPEPEPDPVVATPSPVVIVDPVAVSPEPEPETVAVAPEPAASPTPPDPVDPVVHDTPPETSTATVRPTPQRTRVVRQRRSVKAAPLAIGLGLAAGAGALYAVAVLNKSNTDVIDTGEDLTAWRTRSNVMVMCSGIAGAAAIGVGVTAFVTHDGPMVGVQLGF